MSEIIIKIRRKNQPVGNISARRRRGVIRAHGDDDYLPRRKRKSGLINFYDLGQIFLDDAWRDLDFTIQAAFTSVTAIVDVSLIYQNVIRPAQADIAALDAKIFEIDFENWKTAYRKLDFENAYKYNALLKINNKPQLAKLDSTNNDWTADGLKAQSVNRIAFRTSFAGSQNYTFLPFDTGDTEKVKITDAFDYAATEVSFAGSSGMDVFLLPQMAFQFILFRQNFTNDVYALYLNFRAMPRTRLLDNLQFVNNLPVRSDESVETFLDWTAYYQSLEFAQGLKIPAGGSGEMIDAEDFPSVEAGDIKDYEFAPAFYYSSDINHHINQFFAGKLLAVIRTQSKTFYVWSKVETVQFG